MNFQLIHNLTKLLNLQCYCFLKPISQIREKESTKSVIVFSDVNEIDLRFVNWNQHYNRSNQSYQMLIGICYLIYNGLLQTQNDGTSK